MADRYLATREAAVVLGASVARAWRILRDAGVEPLAVTCREEDGCGREAVWRGVDVRRIAARRAGKDTHRLRVEANIRRGIANARARREAVCR